MAIFLFLLLSIFSPPAASTDIASLPPSVSPWRVSQNLTLVSPDGTFAAGFHQNPPPSSKNYTFAVWVAISAEKTVVWSVRTRPVDASGFVNITAGGGFTISDSSGAASWSRQSSPGSRLTVTNNGSLEFGNWSSFAEPTDTLLPGQPVPSGSGVTTLRNGEFKLVNASLLMHGDYVYSSIAGPIANFTAEGGLAIPGSSPSTLITSDYDTKRLRRLTLEPAGTLRVYSLLPETGRWRIVWEQVQELCTIRDTCGANALCLPDGANATRCVCPPGFTAGAGGAAAGCRPKINPQPKDSKFLRMDFVHYGGGAVSGSWDDGPYKNTTLGVNLADCQAACLLNTGCLAVGYKFDGSRSCAQYTIRLEDGYWSPGTEIATYIRVAAAETAVSTFTAMIDMIDTVCPVRYSLPYPTKAPNTTVRNIAIITVLFALELLAGVLSFWAFLRRYSKYRDMARTLGLEYLPAGGPRRFTYAELKAATRDFSDMIGRGGYGEVYRGKLPDGRAVAVKKLRGSGGGDAEFWAEVTIIARMHHLNLVRMWGFCADKERRMLVYEFVSNGSLDKFLFRSPPPPATTTSSSNDVDPASSDSTPLAPAATSKPILDLSTRYRIAVGVARAVAYLHEECLEWVLHCDIKPENILLEEDFCPKVSDFGLSKLASKKDRVTMSRMRGTRGYMAPEWVKHSEPITAKADVYSFGMVLLEMVSGRRNFEFHRESVESEDWYFPKWAYEKVYVEKKVSEMLDPAILEGWEAEGEEGAETVARMVKTAMWCLQDRAEMRPSMGKVAKMLEGTVEITDPAMPTIFCLPNSTL